jgi:hypothetical protein
MGVKIKEVEVLSVNFRNEFPGQRCLNHLPSYAASSHPHIPFSFFIFPFSFFLFLNHLPC